jgi:dUTP pyrophosphatase
MELANVFTAAVLNDVSALSRTFSKCGILKLYVDSQDDALVDLYRKHVKDHNEAMLTANYPNSGFDLFVPDETVFAQPFVTQMINLGIKTEMFYCDLEKRTMAPSAFVVHPRSSISKTQLMLANHTGIIDSGYRGFLMGAFRWLPQQSATYSIERHTRLLQLCLPTLEPILVYLVETSDELSTTERGAGGFGSTGIVGIQNT